MAGRTDPPAAWVDEFEEDEWDDEDLGFENADSMPPSVRDPFSSCNRVMFRITDRLFTWVLKPLGQAYRTVLPNPARTGISNFFNNVRSPLRFASNLLQGKGRSAGGELAGFLANITAGLGGFMDVTESYPELNPPEEDLGQVLGRWGIGNGLYLYWPVLGPSSLRDTLGMIGDRFLNPASHVKPWPAATGMDVLDRVNAVSYRIEDYEALRDAALIPYEAFRDAYIQYREKAVSE